MNGEKLIKCDICNETKTRKEFYITTKDNVDVEMNECDECVKSSQEHDTCTDCINGICKQTNLICYGNDISNGSICILSPNITVFEEFSEETTTKSKENITMKMNMFGHIINESNIIKNPTDDTKNYWIHAHGISEGCYENHQSYIGKWLIFASEIYINDIWKKINDSTKNGQLGIGSKVSTKFHLENMISSNYVICVYTKDYRDKENVKYILQQLRKIGITHTLYYKADITTLKGIYSSNTPLTKKIGKASMYCSKEFEPDKYQHSLLEY